jgi:hypothetical protein
MVIYHDYKCCGSGFLAGNNLIRESSVNDIPAGDGKIAILFYSVVGHSSRMICIFIC